MKEISRDFSSKKIFRTFERIEDLMMTKERRSFLPALFYISVFAVIYLLIGWVRPMSDDWNYLTSPNPQFSLADLLPEIAFWRPFDALFGGIMGMIPWLFPWLNRLLVVLAHVINAWLVKRIMEMLGFGRQWSRFALCFFLFSSATWAVTVSPDALNQAYSLLFGLLAVYVHLKKGGYYYLLFSAISLLWKESGVSFFFIIPLLDVARRRVCLKAFLKNKEQITKAAKQVLLSLLVVFLYFAVRFLLRGDVQLGTTSGTYKLSFLSVSTLKNFLLLLGSAATGIDSIALLGTDRSVFLVGITAVLSLLFWAGWLIAVISLFSQKKLLFPLVCGGLCVICLALPLSILGHAGEMHAYPVLCGMAVFFGCCFDTAELSLKKVWAGVLAIFLAFGISSVHKLTAIYDYSANTARVEQEISTQYEIKSGKVLFVVIDMQEGYSVFSQSGIFGTSYGDSMRPYFHWARLDNAVFAAQTEEEANQYIQVNQEDFAQIFVVKNDSVKKVK